MAPRLAVVVSQAPMRDARTADIEESIVAELIMVGGLDATLVGPLERIQPDSTDRLCLSGFTQDLALLSWMPAEEAARWWQELELSGTVVPLSLDGSAGFGQGSVAGRRVFYIQLTADSIPSQVCKQLKSRLDLMRVQPVSLQLSMKSPSKALPIATPSNAATSNAATAVMPPASGLPSSGALPTASLQTGSPQATEDASGLVSAGVGRAIIAANEGLAADDEWKNLDQLVDDLDELDL